MFQNKAKDPEERVKMKRTWMIEGRRNYHIQDCMGLNIKYRWHSWSLKETKGGKREKKKENGFGSSSVMVKTCSSWSLIILYSICLG